MPTVTVKNKDKTDSFTVPFGYFREKDLEKVMQSVRGLTVPKKDRVKGGYPFLILVDGEILKISTLPKLEKELASIIPIGGIDIYRNADKGVSIRIRGF